MSERWYPDIERAMVALLEQFVPTPDHVGTDTPADLESTLPFVRVVRTGGFDDRITDFPLIDVDVFDTSKAAANRLAEKIRQFLTVRWRRVGPVVIDQVTTEVGPRQLPWGDDQQPRRVGATYTVHTRRAAA